MASSSTKSGRYTKHASAMFERQAPRPASDTSVHDCKVAQRCIEAMPATELVPIKGYEQKSPARSAER